MSRQSRAPRDSVFANSAVSQQQRADAHMQCCPSLFDCVSAVEDVVHETHNAQQLLRNGTFDLPRMSHVLENQRVFLFVNEVLVKKYKEDLAEEIEPQITELIERAKKGLTVMERRRHLLKTKADHEHVKRATVHKGVESRMEARKLRILTGQRQDLEKELQSLQEELADLENVEDPIPDRA